ncbi:class II aldolase [Candidatus Methylospira mobilis]|uniref:Class II aldolase n=1 Tax=Candidatus Methylospira mobilis TaxID=1808979 RepID=A0A5Q0BJV7_9GAMM|nr:class II aldolase [Candidatus Methylospira mobilis]
MVKHQRCPVDPGSPDQSLRRKLLHITKRLGDLGLNRGTSGNCSVRNASGFLITPSGMTIDEMSSESMVSMDFSGSIIGGGAPSSEWFFHRDILQHRPEVGAVIHTHSVFATTLSCLRKDLPPFHYMVSVAGGANIRCARYALFGTQALSDVALKALDGRRACLLANHGMIVLGRDLDVALAVAVEVETLCEQYLRALQAGEPYLLTDDEMSEVMERFKGYGLWAKY